MSPPPRLAWGWLLLWATIGTLGAVAAVGYDLSRSIEINGTLVDTASFDPGASIIGAELGPDALATGGRHDGASYYVIARDPFDLAGASTALDAPRYRLQRIGFPLAVWALHPVGGGPGLMWTMFAVGVAGLFGGALAVGALSMTWRGPAWIALVFPLLFGSIISLRISVADPLALALTIGALVLFERSRAGDDRPAWRDPRYGAAVALAVAATLTKEPSWLVLLGFVLAERSRRSVALVAVPALVAGAWFVVLASTVPAGTNVDAFAWPFAALPETWALWTSRDEPLAPVNVLAAVLVGALALSRRGLRHPLSYALVLQLAALTVVSTSVLVPERSATRQVLPLFVVGALMLVTPRASERSPVAPLAEAGAM